MPEHLIDGPASAPVHLLLAHGAGSPMTSAFLTEMSALLAARGLCCHRFEFQYMQDARQSGRRKPPPKVESLIPEIVAALDRARSMASRDACWLIGGKSLGGRVASLAAGALFERGEIGGLVCLGYPFHPTGKPERLRTAHLADLSLPVLIIQGDRDPFGTRAEVETYMLSRSTEVCWIEDGDHDFGPRGKSPQTRRGNLAAAADAIARFAKGQFSGELGEI